MSRSFIFFNRLLLIARVAVTTAPTIIRVTSVPTIIMSIGSLVSSVDTGKGSKLPKIKILSNICFFQNCFFLQNYFFYQLLLCFLQRKLENFHLCHLQPKKENPWLSLSKFFFVSLKVKGWKYLYVIGPLLNIYLMFCSIRSLRFTVTRIWWTFLSTIFILHLHNFNNWSLLLEF